MKEYYIVGRDHGESEMEGIGPNWAMGPYADKEDVENLLEIMVGDGMGDYGGSFTVEEQVPEGFPHWEPDPTEATLDAYCRYNYGHSGKAYVEWLEGRVEHPEDYKEDE